MSIPVIKTSLRTKLYFAAVPLLLSAGVALAAGLSLSGYFMEKPQEDSLPYFQAAPVIEEKESQAKTVQDQTLQVARDIFSSAAVDTDKEITITPEVELNEISLSLTVVKGMKRLCLTNGVMLEEGEGGNNFIDKSIWPDGVWYLVSDQDVWIQTGEKIYLDGAGNIIAQELVIEGAGEKKR